MKFTRLFSGKGHGRKVVPMTEFKGNFLFCLQASSISLLNCLKLNLVAFIHQLSIDNLT